MTSIFTRLSAVAALAASALVLAGCGKPAESSVRVGSDFEVDKLFTVDGCAVYRFSDAGHLRYFTNCSGSTAYSVSSGKSSRPDGVYGGGR